MLKEGDIIKLEKDMVVYGDIPEMFVYGNRLISKKKTHNEIIIGHTYHNQLNMQDSIKKVSKNIIEAFNYEGFEIDFKKVINFIEDNISKPSKETFILEGGEFIVYKAYYDGGGTGMGDHDIYPDGHYTFFNVLKRFDHTHETIEI